MNSFKLSRRNAFLSIALVVTLMLVGVFGFVQSTTAGPTVPTNVVIRRCANPQVVTLYTAIITQSGRGPYVPNALTGPYCDLVDIQWSVTTSGTAANGVTLAYQVSNDNSVWATASTITSGITTTISDMAEVANFGVYGAVSATLTSTAQVTLTAIGLYK